MDYIWCYWRPDADEHDHLARLKRETFGVPGAAEAVVNGYYQALLTAPDGTLGVAPIMRTFDVPTLAIYGEQDPIPPVLAHDEEQRYEGEYRCRWVAGAHQFVHRDRPYEVRAAGLAAPGPTLLAA